MSERGEPVGRGELRNNNQQAGVPSDGDANANDIQTDDGGRTGETGTLSRLTTETAEQDKVIIWGTDSQCDDPELAEFEMLECQELEAYLVEEGEDFVGLGERKDLHNQPSLCDNVAAEPTTDMGNSKEGRKAVQRGTGEQEGSASHVSESKGATECVAGTELSSENDVFVSCLSTLSSLGGSLASALDTAARTQTTDSWHVPSSGPCRTISEDLTSQSCNTISERSKASQRADRHSLPSGISTMQRKDVDMNRNSTILSEGVILEAQVSNGVVPCKEHIQDINEHSKNLNQRYGKLGNTVSLEREGDHDKGGINGKAAELKALNAATKSNEESNNKIDKSTQADETPDMNQNQPKTGTKGTQSSTEFKAIKKQGSFDKTPNKQNSFDKSLKKQPSFESSLKKQLSFDNTQKTQGSLENTQCSGSSSLERRKPWGSPSRPATPISPKTTLSPKRRPPGSPAKVQSTRAPSLERSDSPQRGSISVKQPYKVSANSGIPKPITVQQKESETRRCSPPQKPKNVRPKIITYVRKNPQAKPQVTDAPYEASSLPLRLSSYPSPPAHKDPKVGPQLKATPVLCSSNLLFDKYRHEMQKAGFYPQGMGVSGVKAPSNAAPQKLSGKSESFHGELPDKHLLEVRHFVSYIKGNTFPRCISDLYLPQHPSQDAGNLYRSPRALRPQLGLGAVTRQPANKTKVPQTGQRSAMVLSQSTETAGMPTHGSQDLTAEPRKSQGPETAPKNLLLKPGQSGLRAPGFSALPPARLAAFGFVRSGSVSSVSSNQSNDSTHSDPCRPSQPVPAARVCVNKRGPWVWRDKIICRSLTLSHSAADTFDQLLSYPRLEAGFTGEPLPSRHDVRRILSLDIRSVVTAGPGSGSDDTPLHRSTAPPSDVSRAPGCGGPHPPNAPALQRRTVPPPPRCSPHASRKEIQKDVEPVPPPVNSPKRFAVVPPKPQSPVHGRTTVGREAARSTRAQDSERAQVQKLRERCEEQARQVQTLQAQLKKASLGLEVFAITTQHFCQKSESAIVKERELSLELARIRDEVAFSVSRWEHLQQDKEELERHFERELQGLRAQQKGELGALEERLRAQHTAEIKRLQTEQREDLAELRTKQQEQVEEMGENHEASLMEMETAHNDTLATLREEHARTVKTLKMAHEQQKKSLEEEFEKLRLSLQDQVDTLTFQNRSLRDRAKRFEEALRKSTDEQIVDALAPYQHIEEDLKSLKEVLEMKNQQIHQQELKISELEKMQAEKNVYLEERVQVLQQQNEDLKARIDNNLAVSRQLSEENANLQVHVEKESNEKKRLSRTNEELLWRLQTGELSPRMTPDSSPIHRPSPGPGSPARPHSYHQ
ncbi:microtubule-associated tumor suppressor candidate 2 [Polymixia lowei]